MDQDGLLERFWTQIIDAVPSKLALVKGEAAMLDVRHAARLARYEFVFAWCVAFDDSGLEVSQWLSLADSDERWRGLCGSAGWLDAEPQVPVGDPSFGDAQRALRALYRAGVRSDELARVLDRELTAARSSLREILGAGSFEEGDLVGLHEGLLSADPSGQEARSGTWPRRARRREQERRTGPAPLVRIQRAHHLALSPDGELVVAAGKGAVTEVRTGRVVAACKWLPNTSQVVWSPDGSRFAAANTSGNVAVFDSESGGRLHAWTGMREGTEMVFSSDGATLYRVDWGGTLVAWSLASGQEQARRKLDGVMAQALGLGHDRLVVLVSHPPEPAGEVWFLSPGTLEDCAPVLAFGARLIVTDMALEPNGSMMIVCEHDALARVDVRSGEVVQRHAVAALNVALSPDGRWCVTTQRGGFWIAPVDDLSKGTQIPMRYASGRASFSACSTRVALATWEVGEVWELSALLEGR